MKLFSLLSCGIKNASGDFQLLFFIHYSTSVIAGLYSVNMFLCVNNSIKNEIFLHPL